MAKLLENAYRATNIAFIDEWTRLAENAGVDLFDVVNSIRVRKGTHDTSPVQVLARPGCGLENEVFRSIKDAEGQDRIEALAPFGRRRLQDPRPSYRCRCRREGRRQEAQA